MRREFSWTEKQLAKLEAVKAAITEWRAYWPLTLRQLYYQLVSKEIIKNNTSEYKMLSKLLKHARLDGEVDWAVMEDRVRSTYFDAGYRNVQDFIESEKDGIFSGYRRNLYQDQDVYLELWIEKDALSSIFSKIGSRYQVRTVVCRGFSSVTFLEKFKNRHYANGDKKTIMLYFGDFDPSGYEMLPAMIETLQDEMNCYDIEFKRIALTKQDIADYKLPHNPDAVKKSDSRYKKFTQRHGEYAVELDALPPDILVEKIEAAIKSELDMEKIEAQRLQEYEDHEKIDEIREQVEKYIHGLLYDFDFEAENE